MVKISCVIPTYQGPHTLLRSMRSLQQQTLSDFEILVVDNAADLEIEKLVAEFNQTAKLPAHYIPEPQLGLHNARHAGAREAKGELLVFTDDDATFDPHWLETYANAFTDHPEMVAGGGPVRPCWENPPPVWFIHYLEQTKLNGLLSLMELSTTFRLDSTVEFFGVNMAIRRATLFEVGGFHPESFGEIWLGDGESGLNRKLRERQMLIGYLPPAIVYHHIPPDRMTIAYLRQRMANQSACDLYAYYQAEGVPPRWRLALDVLRLAIRKKLWLRPLLYRSRTDPHGVDVQLHAAHTFAQAQYMLRLIYNNSFRALIRQKDWLKSENLNHGAAS